MFKGSIAALITPFGPKGIDEKKVRQLVNWHIKQGTNGVVPCGTTGESPTLTHQEHMRVIEIVVEEANGRIPVIAGTGSNCTDEAVSLTKHAKSAGANGCLMITPYYNKPNQKGIFAHFAKVADKAGLPVILYNHQGRTGVTIQPETVEALSKVGPFVAVKDASGGIGYSSEVIARTGGKVAILSGNDGWTPSLMAIGAAGCISVVANIIPAKFAKMIDLFAKGEAAKSRKIYYEILPLINAMDIDVNPLPVKAAMGMLGMANPQLRLPLTPMDKVKMDKLRAVLKQQKLLK